jgi:hypothetical protein
LVKKFAKNAKFSLTTLPIGNIYYLVAKKLSHFFEVFKKWLRNFATYHAINSADCRGFGGVL